MCIIGMLCLDIRLFHVITFSIYLFFLINYYAVATILLVNKDEYITTSVIDRISYNLHTSQIQVNLPQ